jgi:vacuolar protein sorting-associated protein 41
MRIPLGLSQKGYLGQLGGAIGSGMTTVGSGLYTGVETVGQGVWDATMYGPRKLGASRLFNTGDSIRSGRPDSDKPASVKEQRNYLTGWLPGFGSSTAQQDDEVKDVAQTRGMKIFIFSPYDCIVAVKRNLADRLQWLLNTNRYEQAWKLLDTHPEAAGASSEPSTSTPPTPSKASSVAKSASITSGPSVAARQQATLAEFFADSASISSTVKGGPENKFSNAEKEKRRIGELWLKQLIADKKWSEAGEVAGKALNTTTRWEHWVWIFIKNQKFDEISPYVPTLDLTPPLPSLVFEIILGHYVSIDRHRFRELLDQWPSDIFDISSITTAIDGQLTAVEKGSDDWRILQECLAKLYLADGQYDDALRCYIRLQDADTALSLIKDHHLIEAVANNIPAFVQLRVSAQQLQTAPRNELEDLASEPIRLLVDEAEHGLVDPEDVIDQLESAKLSMFLYFYLRGLWRGEGTQVRSTSTPLRGIHDRTNSLAVDASKMIVEQFADRAVSLFAEYDRDLLSEFLHASTSYTFDKAVKVCEQRNYIPELVFLLSKTGQVKKALFLIIDKLNDVSKAIEFAKEQDDPDLWDDFLDYSMSRPRFISGLLAEVGTAVDPITLVKRIPSGLEIQGLKDGLKKMIREYDLQDSISAGVAQVLAGEVAVGMQTLRQGRRKGIRFEMAPPRRSKEKSEDSQTQSEPEPSQSHNHNLAADAPQPGHCASCNRPFLPEGEKETIVGFACGHVYHVSHLLHGPDAEDEGPSYLPELGKGKGNENEYDDGGGGRTFTRSIGPKVTNARLLREKIANVGGCRICRDRTERIREVE